MSIEVMVVTLAIVTVTLTIIALIARSSHLSKEQGILKELGFASVESMPAQFESAMRNLHAPKAKPASVKFKHPLRRQYRWGDLYHVEILNSSDEHSKTMLTNHGLSGYQEQWKLSKITVLVIKEPQGRMEKLIQVALRSVVGKRKDQLHPAGWGEFGSRAVVFGENEIQARHVLTKRVQHALLGMPYVMLEMDGSIFSLYRPAHAGKGPDDTEEWRQLLDTSRLIGEELPK